MNMTPGRNKIIALAAVVAALIISSVLVFQYLGPGGGGEIDLAPDFTAKDQMNRTFSLRDFTGNVTLLHFTQFESPVCLECERQMKDQLSELVALAEDAGGAKISIVTLNVRKNAYSPDGWTLARDWYGINVSWHWVEEFEPYAAAGLYQKYWDMGGNFANPTLVLIDANQNLVGVYHVYTMSHGEVDGVQSAESLREDALSISRGEWTVFRGELTEGTTYLGIFLLGIISSFSPCSLFMLFAIVSYIISSDEPGKSGSNVQARALDWRAGLWIGIAFSAGMTLTFALLGALASYAGAFIESSTAFSLIVGIALVILGINIIWPLGEFLRRLRKPGKEIAGGSDDSAKKLVQRLGRDRRGLIGLVLGILFTIGWTPCALAMVLPVLVMIMSGTVSILTGMALMCVFALGRGMVVTSFCAAIGGMKSKIYGQFIKAGKWIQPIFGIAMVALGIIYALRYWGFNLW